MKKLVLSAAALAFLATGTIARAALLIPQAAQSPSSAQYATAKPVDKTLPSYDMKAQALLDLDGVNQKFIQLAEAIPQDKFTWRPAEGTRTVAQVFLHVAGERYLILGLGGAQPPADFDGKTYEDSTTDKAKIIEQLHKTWEFAQATISGMTNADFAKLLPKLGPEANAGDVVYILVADAHEHLGQSVAYARVLGVVPPWTIAAKKAAEEKAAKDKAAGDKKD